MNKNKDQVVLNANTRPKSKLKEKEIREEPVDWSVLKLDE